MFNVNSGYLGHSMSVRAHNAYCDGLVTKTGINKSFLTEHQINIAVSFLKWLIVNEHITATEWHHTSKHFNETDFYSAEDIKDQLDSLVEDNKLDSLHSEYIEYKKASKTINKGYYALITFREWVGSSNYGNFKEYEAYAYVLGDWAHIDIDRKKSLKGRHLNIIKTFNRKPRAFNTKVRNQIFKKLKIK